jgi:hypothetical protein
MERQQLIIIILVIRLKIREKSGMVGINLLKIRLSPGLLSLKLCIKTVKRNFYVSLLWEEQSRLEHVSISGGGGLMTV